MRCSSGAVSFPGRSKPVALHPAILRRYEEQLLWLEHALGRGVSAADAEAAEAIRDLVETVTVFRHPERRCVAGNRRPAKRADWPGSLSEPGDRGAGKGGSGGGTRTPDPRIMIPVL